MEKAPDIIIEHEADMIEKLEKVDYTERLLYGVYLVKEEDGVYLLDNGIKSKKPLMIEPNGLCYMLPPNSSLLRWYSIEEANEKFKKGNIVEIKYRNGIFPVGLDGISEYNHDETTRYEMGDYVLIIDIYKRPKNDL